MNQFIGTKIINAKPMTRLEYNNFRGWTVPADENPADEGYLVEYVDGGQANTKEYAGYVSWSPKEVFERAYRENGKLTFGDALVYMKEGKRLLVLDGTEKTCGSFTCLLSQSSIRTKEHRRTVSQRLLTVAATLLCGQHRAFGNQAGLQVKTTCSQKIGAL